MKCIFLILCASLMVLKHHEAAPVGNAFKELSSEGLGSLPVDEFPSERQTFIAGNLQLEPKVALGSDDWAEKEETDFRKNPEDVSQRKQLLNGIKGVTVCYQDIGCIDSDDGNIHPLNS